MAAVTVVLADTATIIVTTIANSYMMMAQMMAAQNQTTYTTTTELDKDRFYKAILNGPLTLSENGGPRFRLVFAIPKE